MIKKNKILILIIPLILSIGIASSLFLPNVYAEESFLVELVDKDPYFWSEDNFGIDILRVYKAPLTSYLTPGITNSSTNDEIMDAYYKANADTISTTVIEQENDRAISYRLHIDSPEIFEDVTSYYFQKFNPATNPNEFSLESLSSKDNQGYYEFASRYMNPGKRPDLFDATIDVITGDGTVLQKWKYIDCKITYFETFLQNNLLFLMFAGGLQSEIRDHSDVECITRFIIADMDNVFNPYIGVRQKDAKSYPTDLLHKIPTPDERASSYLVSFVGSEIPEEVKIQSFQNFGPIGATIAQYSALTGLSITPQFFLESLVSKDKKGYYEYISRYINPGKIPETFDVNVDLVAGDGTSILRWQYFDCAVTNFETYLDNDLLFIRFHDGLGGEIRDHTEFECDGFHITSQSGDPFSPYTKLLKIGPTTPITKDTEEIIPTDDDRAMSFVVHFIDGDFANSPLTLQTFSQFRQSEITEFYLESLISQDKNELYDLIISHTLNPGRIPDPFTVYVDLVSGDGTILQKWQYYQCQVSDYQTWLDDDLLSFRFSKGFISEIREKISFECIGQELVTDPLKPLSIFTSRDVATHTLNPTTELGHVIPTDDERAISYVVHLSGIDIPQEKTFATFANFQTHGKTVTNETQLQVYDKQKPSFYLESLPSKDKEDFYMLLAKYINPGKSPEPFDVTVDIIAGDTTILQSWQYFGCEVVGYEPFLLDGIWHHKYNDDGDKSEIRDTTLFECEGAHFETPRLKAFSPYADIHNLSEETQISNETDNIILNSNDRPMSYVVHFSEGEIIIPHTYLTFSKYKQTSSTEFWLESLVSQDKEFFYDFIIARYINPGDNPQLFDVSVDLVTADGTILQSWQYHNCEATDYVTFRDDLFLFIRFIGKIDYEIRDKTSFDCAGVNIDIENKIPFSIHADIFAKGLKVKPSVPGIIVPPHKQLSSEISSYEIECKREMEQMIRPSNALPYCVQAHSVTILQEKGWKHISKKLPVESIDESKTDSTIIQAVLPNDNERAMSFKISAIGRDIPEVIQSIKFSKFAPFTSDDIIIDTEKFYGVPLPGTAEIPGDKSTIVGVIPYYQFGQKPGFYLESLPGKDKQEFYKWISRYVNPGKTPELVDFGVEILDGDGNTVQTWIYRDCKGYSYQLFLEENILMYKYHEQWQSEIKDRTMFLCNGLHLNEI